MARTVICTLYVFLIEISISLRVESWPAYNKVWEEWKRDMSTLKYPGMELTAEGALGNLTRFCTGVFPTNELDQNICIKHYLDDFKRQRGRENGIYLSVGKSDRCSSADLIDINGEKLSIRFDKYDSATDIAQLLSRHLNLSPDSDHFKMIESSMDQLLESIPFSKEKICLEAKSRREWLLKRESEVKMKRESYTNIVSSSVVCFYPFSQHEWIRPELWPVIPLGSCEYQNLYIHNNKWYFVSDTVRLDDLPRIRFNTRVIEFRPQTYDMNITVVSRADLKNLLRSSILSTDLRLLKVHFFLNIKYHYL